MKTIALSVVLATAAFAGAAHAQETYVPHTPFTASEQDRTGGGAGGGWDNTNGAIYPVNPAAERAVEAGLAALEEKNFARAEEVFGKVVQRNPRNASANFYLGATRMDLGKWADAKEHLEIAASKMPKHPDPKSRLGVTYAMLGDAAGAQAQRVALVQMADACKARCRLAPYITAGIEMIDKAMAEATRN